MVESSSKEQNKPGLERYIKMEAVFASIIYCVIMINSPRVILLCNAEQERTAFAVLFRSSQTECRIYRISQCVSDFFIVKKIPSKWVILSDFICIFAMSEKSLFVFPAANPLGLVMIK